MNRRTSMGILHKTFIAVVLLASVHANASPIRHVLLVSVDGLHAIDFDNYVAQHPDSTFAQLAHNGIEYTDAHTPTPSDSFPGILALTTGGTPGSTGVYYDETYARRLSPPGSACSQVGTAVVYDSSVDQGTGAQGAASLNPAKLPLDPDGCKPVYPHNYLLVNTIFEVARQAGGYTAWIDKHPVYEILEGPSGKGVDDLYTPEIGENYEGKSDRAGGKITSSIAGTDRYDEHKVDALISEVRGYMHDGQHAAPVPMIFGLNLQVVNVGQKLAGYLDAQGAPTNGLETALADSDRDLGKIVSALRDNHLLDSTLVIVTAKHGNGPVDMTKLRHIDQAVLKNAVTRAAPGALGKLTNDQGALIWLKVGTRTDVIARALWQQRKQLGISRLLWGRSLSLYFPPPAASGRTPDIVVLPEPGVIYAKAGDRKKVEHGGFSDDDTHVALVVSNPLFQAKVIRTPVATTQVAPTILASLGLAPADLQAVRVEGTPLLPGPDWQQLSK